MFRARSGRLRWAVVPLVALAAVLQFPAPASAAPIQLFEEAAEAFWEVPHTCADGSIVPGTFLVRTTRFFEAPATEDPDPTVRVQFLAVCPDGISFSWGAAALPATITSKKGLKRVTAVAAGVARDNLGRTHQVTVDAKFKGVGPVEKIVGGPGSVTKIREAKATALVTFDGAVLVDGPANHPTRPAPFIRVDIER